MKKPDHAIDNTPCGPLTDTEAFQLREAEAVVKAGLQTFVEVGDALALIRDRRLYRATFATFEEYVGERWGMSRSRAFRLICAAQVTHDVAPPLPENPTGASAKGQMLPMGNISTPAPKPASERQARPLTELKSPEDRREAWREAVAASPKTEAGKPKVTAEAVAKAVQKVKARRALASSEADPPPPAQPAPAPEAPAPSAPAATPSSAPAPAAPPTETPAALSIRDQIAKDLEESAEMLASSCNEPGVAEAIEHIRQAVEALRTTPAAAAKPARKPKPGDLAIEQLPEPLRTTTFHEKWGEWAAYRREKRVSLTESTIKVQLARLSKEPEHIATAIIDLAIGKGWKGLVYDAVEIEALRGRKGRNGHGPVKANAVGNRLREGLTV